MRLDLCPPLPLLCRFFVFRWHCEEGEEEESTAKPSILGVIVPPLHCCRHAIATTLLPRCPPLPPCRCRAIIATLLLCCRCRAATDGCQEAAAVTVLPPRCCHRRHRFYCRCHCHRCHTIVLPPLDAVTTLLPPPCCRAAHRCLPTTTLPAATAPTPRCHCRCRTAATVADRHLLSCRCRHCRAADTTAALPPPPLLCCQHHQLPQPSPPPPPSPSFFCHRFRH
jgi:hypothetical protein